MKKLHHSDVHIIFDRYYDYSIKSGTRLARGKEATRRHVLHLNSPLPPQNVTLNVTQNKVQLINYICDTLVNDALEMEGAGNL